MKVQILACLLYRVLFPSRNADESSDSVFKEAPYDDAAIVGLTSSTLRELSLNPGSWVIVKDVHTNVGLARVFVLNPPDKKKSIEFHKS